jgi:hypothetical protein
MATLTPQRADRIRDALTITRGYTTRAYWLTIGQHLPRAITISVRVWHGVHAEERVSRRQINARLAWAQTQHTDWDDLTHDHTWRTLILHLDNTDQVEAYRAKFGGTRPHGTDEEN